VGRRHLAWIGNRAARLLFQVFGAAIPKLRHVQAGVQHRGRVDGAFLPIVSNGCFQIVRTAHRQVVARVAGNKSRLGQAGIKEQFLTQIDHALVFHLGHLDHFNGLFVFGPGLGHHQTSGHGNGHSHCRYGKPLFHTRFPLTNSISVNLYKGRIGSFESSQSINTSINGQFIKFKKQGLPWAL